MAFTAKHNRFEQGDFNQNKTTGALGYLIFFIPLIACPNSKFGRYCANQGLWLLIAHAALSISSMILRFIPFFGWIVHIAQVGLVVLAIIFMIKAMDNDAWEIPYVGNIKLIK